MDKIRLAKRTDALRITRLFNSNRHLLGDSETGYNTQDIKDFLRAKMSRVILYERNGKLIGAFFAQFWRDYVYLHTIIVGKSHRRQGIGKKLMDYVEELAKKEGKSLIEFDVGVENKGMKSFLKDRHYRKGKTFTYYSKEI